MYIVYLFWQAVVSPRIEFSDILPNVSLDHMSVEFSKISALYICFIRNENSMLTLFEIRVYDTFLMPPLPIHK